MKTKTVLLLCILLGAYSQNSQANIAPEIDSLSIWVNGACGMCKTRIEDAALKVKGVESASWDTKKRQLNLTVDLDRFKVIKLHYKIASVGHDTKEMLAPDPVYDALPMCCKYRDPNNPHFQEHSGDQVTGSVSEIGEQGEKQALLAANVYWAETGSGTITDADGHFTIPLEEGSSYLVVSYVGYQNDTLFLDYPADVEVEFSKALMLEEVQVVHRIKPTSIDFSSAYNILTMHEKELTKAACCNLSESFVCPVWTHLYAWNLDRRNPAEYGCGIRCERV
jgi:hypothetical protein